MAITLFHAPRTRSTRIVWLLEELGLGYTLEPVALQGGRSAAHLAVHPLGKVPALVDGDLHLFESGAIALHLADRYGAGTLAPRPDEPDRAAYLDWLFFHAGCIEPAWMERLDAIRPNPEMNLGMLGWGSFERTLRALEAGLSPGPYLLGARFTAVDILVGGSVNWGIFGKFIPADGVFGAYSKAVSERPAFLKSRAIDKDLVERLAALPAG